MTHACAVVDYFEHVIGLTRDDEISEEFAFLWTGDYRCGVAAKPWREHCASNVLGRHWDPESRGFAAKDLLFAATIGAVAMNCLGFGRITAKRPEKFFPQSVTAPACDSDHGLSSRNGKPCTIAACCFLPRKPVHTSNHAPTT